MQLESTLAQFPLAELITMITGSSVTGTLELGDVANAKMYFRDGRLYHAVADGYAGADAVCHIFTLKDAPFRFTAAATADEETIWQDAWDLIEFAEHYAATWERVKKFVPSFDCVPVLVQSNGSKVLINEAAWKTLAAIDGQRSVEAVAEQIGQVPLEVAAALCDLIEQGVVRIVQPRASLAWREGKSSSTGFFGRLMSTPYPSDARN